MRYNGIIFEGGGTKGIAYIGALKRLEEENVMDIKYVGGSSAGSQIATMIAADISIDEMEEYISKAPFGKMLDGNCGCIRDIYRLIFKYGYYKGEYLERYIENILYKKHGIKNITFKTLYEKTKIKLRITGTCINTHSLEWFDYENTPNMKVSKAVMISSSIPFVYKAVKYENKYYVDGGCINNFPIDAFEDGKIIGLNLQEEHEEIKIRNIKDYTIELMNTIIKEANEKERKKNVDIIDIYIGKHSAIDFKIDEKKKDELKQNGYESVKKYYLKK